MWTGVHSSVTSVRSPLSGLSARTVKAGHVTLTTCLDCGTRSRGSRCGIHAAEHRAHKNTVYGDPSYRSARAALPIEEPEAQAGAYQRDARRTWARQHRPRDQA
jgi:hypothetical protein